MTVEPIVPYIFPTAGGENVSPHQVNENAQSLYDAALRAMSKRYNYFPVVLDPGVLASNDNAVEGQWSIRVPFDYEVVSAELIAYGDDDGTPSSGTESIALTCSQSGWNTLTATASHADPTTRGRDFKNQSLRVSADDTVTWTISLPVTANAECRVYALLYCRYDMVWGFNELASQRTLTPPPQVRDGEALSVSEWNAWFDSFEADELTHLVTAAKQRRRFEVINLGRNIALATTATSSGAFIALPGKKPDYLEEARVYGIKNTGVSQDIVFTMYDHFAAQNLWTRTLTIPTSSTLATAAATISNAETSSSPVAALLDLDISGGTSVATLGRCYAVCSWRVIS